MLVTLSLAYSSNGLLLLQTHSGSIRCGVCRHCLVWQIVAVVHMAGLAIGVLDGVAPRRRHWMLHHIGIPLAFVLGGLVLSVGYGGHDRAS